MNLKRRLRMLGIRRKDRQILKEINVANYIESGRFEKECEICRIQEEKNIEFVNYINKYFAKSDYTRPLNSNELFVLAKTIGIIEKMARGEGTQQDTEAFNKWKWNLKRR